MSISPTGDSILRGKRCLLTGATGGLGRALATVLCAAGVDVFLTGRDEEALARFARQVGSTRFAAADLGSTEEVLSVASKASDAVGGIDLLINNAGIFPIRPLGETSVVEFDACFDVNIRAPFLLCRHFAPRMAARGWGRIVNIASSSAYSGFRNTSIYCASKHALLGLSRALFDEYKGSGVRIFCVSPGSIRTAMGLTLVDQSPDSLLDPSEVATFIVDLISYDGTMTAEEVRLNRIPVE